MRHLIPGDWWWKTRNKCLHELIPFCFSLYPRTDRLSVIESMTNTMPNKMGKLVGPAASKNCGPNGQTALGPRASSIFRPDYYSTPFYPQWCLIQTHHNCSQQTKTAKSIRINKRHSTTAYCSLLWYQKLLACQWENFFLSTQWLGIKHLDPISDHPFFECYGFSYLVIWFYEQFKA